MLVFQKFSSCLQGLLPLNDVRVLELLQDVYFATVFGGGRKGCSRLHCTLKSNAFKHDYLFEQRDVHKQEGRREFASVSGKNFWIMGGDHPTMLGTLLFSF